MTALVIPLVAYEELKVIEQYVLGQDASDLEEIFDALEISNDATPTRHEIAVAAILLRNIEGSLPQWASVSSEDEVTLSRKPIVRHPEATKFAYQPKLMCCVNWADSGPGFSWPEAYHITYIPGFNQYVVTSSRDGSDIFGVADHAIGNADGSRDPIEVARELVVKFWWIYNHDGEQERWAYLFDEGLIGSQTAEEWAEEIWPIEAVEEEKEE